MTDREGAREESFPPEEQRPSSGSVGDGVQLGCFLVVLLEALLLAAVWAVAALPVPALQDPAWLPDKLFLPGVGQWLLVVPAVAVLWRRGRTDTLRGLLITAGVIALMTGVCVATFAL